MKNNAERTPQHNCSIAGHVDIAQLLLTFGALDACFDSQGSVYVIALCPPLLIKVFLFARLTALHYAVESNSTVLVKAFVPLANLSHLPDANDGRTPLMNAAQNASHAILKVNHCLHLRSFAVENPPQVLLLNRAVMKTINHTDTDGRTGL